MELMELLRTRRTYRRFDGRPVPDEVLSDILEAARVASSGANRQPLRYLVVRRPEQAAQVFAHTRWAAYLPPEQGTPAEGERPTLYVAVLVDETTAKQAAAAVDAGLAMSNMTLAAWNRGVGSCIIGAFDRPALTEYFGLPDHLVLQNLVAFGYPSHKSFLEEWNGSPVYFLDENRDYHVPKRSLADTVRFFDQTD